MFPNDQAVNTYLTRVTGVDPADWHDVFGLSPKKSLRRDPLPPHKAARAGILPGQLGWRQILDCQTAQSIIRDTSFPNISIHPSADIIKGCGEKQATPTGGQKK